MLVFNLKKKGFQILRNQVSRLKFFLIENGSKNLQMSVFYPNKENSKHFLKKLKKKFQKVITFYGGIQIKLQFVLKK